MSQFTLSAFADEISPDPLEQVSVLAQCGVKNIEFRSIHKTNVLDLSDAQIQEFKIVLKNHDCGLSAIGSPIGKIKADQPFEPHLTRFNRAMDLCEVFGTRNIRIFSYYLPEGSQWSQWKDEVFKRMETKVALAQKRGLMLFHENEHGIYGDSPDRVNELLVRFNGPCFKAAFDPANYVFCGFDPWEGWLKARDYTAHFHAKDWVAGEKHGCLAGTGGGKFPAIINDMVARNYHGFATLEPHLLGGGPTGGTTGPELFPKAVKTFKEILLHAGATVG
ncbi:MAG: sugar phosphate isomerase/epimerase [Gemmataceae bacterium]|nr:sugar phosphate isomerase/epimerase [Gemmataceae bacterium]